MNEEYIYVKTNDVQKDMYEFVNQFGDEISSVSYVGDTIKLKNGVVYRFTDNTIGIRKYYTYIEVYIYHLEFKSKKLKQENQQLKEQLQQKEDIINKAKNWIDNHDVDDSWELLEILDNEFYENQQLKTEKEQLNSLVNSCQKEIRRLKKELQALKTSEEEWLEKSDK